jgi:hypothetical protein
MKKDKGTILMVAIIMGAVAMFYIALLVLLCMVLKSEWPLWGLFVLPFVLSRLSAVLGDGDDLNSGDNSDLE